MKKKVRKLIVNESLEKPKSFSLNNLGPKEKDIELIESGIRHKFLEIDRETFKKTEKEKLLLKILKKRYKDSRSLV